MILTGPKIDEEVRAGKIIIEPYDAQQLNPNSYNYRLSPEILRVVHASLTPDEPNIVEHVEVTSDGVVLEPKRLYLGATVEVIGSPAYVTSLIGRSSVGRLGLFLQVSADLAQLGAAHQWTLELVAVQPIRVYPGMTIGQVSFWEPDGARRMYEGYYGRFSSPTPCAPIKPSLSARSCADDQLEQR